MFGLLIFCFIVGAAHSTCTSRTPPQKPCKLDDNNCLLKNFKEIVSYVILGDDTVNIPSLDPLLFDEVVGNLPTLQFNLTNVVFKGLKDNDVENVKVCWDKSKLFLDVIFTKYNFSGDYTMSGHVMTLPVEGNGTFNIDSKKYRLSLDCDIEVIVGNDSKKHLHIKNFNLEQDPCEGLIFDFKNLYNGFKEFSDAVHKHMNNNWRDVAINYQEPTMVAVMERVIDNLNILLRLSPIEEVLIIN